MYNTSREPKGKSHKLDLFFLHTDGEQGREETSLLTFARFPWFESESWHLISQCHDRSCIKQVEHNEAISHTHIHWTMVTWLMSLTMIFRTLVAIERDSKDMLYSIRIHLLWPWQPPLSCLVVILCWLCITRGAAVFSWVVKCQKHTLLYDDSACRAH